MRTQNEIVERIKSVRDDDPLGFETSILAEHLDDDHLTLAGYERRNPSRRESMRPVACDRDTVLSQMRDYMGFAWDKAKNHRGISASRSVDHFKAWQWLAGDDLSDAPYAQYGAPILMDICQRYGFPIPNDEGLLRMARGEKCFEGCDEGCGR